MSSTPNYSLLSYILLLSRLLLVRVSLISLTMISCTPETIVREWSMLLDIYTCLDEQSCVDGVLSQTTLGCYVTQDVNELATIRRQRFLVSEDRTLSFEDGVVPQAPGDRFNGSLFFFDSRSSCDDLLPESGCGEGCLLRMRHTDVTIGVNATTITFKENGSCDLLSDHEEIQRVCFSEDEPDLDLRVVDMSVDEGVQDLDLDPPDVDPKACTEELLGTQCEVEEENLLGACAQGIYSCVNEELVCQPHEATAELCDLIDNDCDGTIDEVETVEVCERGVGACLVQGAFACVGGNFDCVTPPIPEPAISDLFCDGIDEDCDGIVDEDYQPTEVSCGVGACLQSGFTRCEIGEVVNDCIPGQPRENDLLCDGIDEDCDAVLDEDYVGQPVSCGVGACIVTGVNLCVEGAEVPQCTPNNPALEDISCDGIDDDCDGSIDEDYIEQTISCGVGACSANGVKRCTQGTEEDQCTPREPAPNDENCNGLDDDCNGIIDDGYQIQQTTCGLGSCVATGSQLCQEGELIDTCVAGQPLSDTDENCNGIDENCNGITDEGFISFPGLSCGQGVCEQPGQYICEGGILVNQCTPSLPPSQEDASDGLCNHIDDDCDGMIDENYPSTPTSCGVGVCVTNGELTCVNGEVIDTCTPEAIVGGVVDDCDGLDNDCDGFIDEDFEPNLVNCSLAESCVLTGYSTCEAGIAGDTCDTAQLRDSDNDGLADPCAWVPIPSADPLVNPSLEILRHEITFGAYRDCIEQGGCSTHAINYTVGNENNPSSCNFITQNEVSDEPENFPLRCVTNNQLIEYCTWIGGRVPTKNELLVQIHDAFGPFTCDHSISGSCPDQTPDPKVVCSLEVIPGELPICDLGGNVYELALETIFNASNIEYMQVCFDDYYLGESQLNRCATQKLSEPTQRIGGRCVRSLNP